MKEKVNSTFVNVTISAEKMVNGKFSLADLMYASKGWWVMNEDIAEQIEYVFPVRKNEVLGVFKVVGYEKGVDEKNGRSRINFDLKMIFEGSTQLLESAKTELTSTHYVVKQFSI
jgi:hypothetical protein